MFVRPYTATLYTQRNIQQIDSKCARVGRFRGRPEMSETTATFFAEHELSSYTAAFDEHG